MADLRKAMLAEKEQHLRAAEKIDRDLKVIDDAAKVAAEYGFKIVGPDEDKVPARPQKVPNGAATESKTAKIRRISAAHIRATGKRATSGALAKVLAEHGVTIPGKYLSAVLSKSSEFDNRPALGGYGLVSGTVAPGAPSGDLLTPRQH